MVRSELKFSDPSIYHIQVLGRICPELWDYYDGETLQTKEDKNGQETNLIRIHVRDQAELSGLINMLYDWRLVLLSVKIEGPIEEIES